MKVTEQNKHHNRFTSGPIVAAHSRSADIVSSRPLISSVHAGSSHVFPESGPIARGAVHSSTSTVATMSLSATGSRNAPNAECKFCEGEEEARVQSTAEAMFSEHFKSDAVKSAITSGARPFLGACMHAHNWAV